MSIRVEFYGIPRSRAGVAATSIETDGQAVSICSVFDQLGDRFPQLRTDCLLDDGLRPGFIANVDGQSFVGDPNDQLQPGTCLLIMSADAGG